MIFEIIVLYFLCKKNGTLAINKGLSAPKWKLYTVLSWFAAEVMGIIIGVLMFGNIDPAVFNNMASLENSNIYGLIAIAWMSAFGGYLIIKSILEKKPDSFDEDINKISVHDLRPPQKN